MKAMPGFFIKKFRKFLIKCFAEESFPAGVLNARITAAAVDADPVTRVEGRFVFVSKSVGVPGLIRLGFQPGDKLTGRHFISL